MVGKQFGKLFAVFFGGVGGHSAADIAKRGSAELYTRPPRTQVARCYLSTWVLSWLP